MENNEYFLTWKAPGQSHTPHETDVVKYVVYEFFPGETLDTEDAQTIVAMTPYTKVKIDPEKGVTFAVSSLDRMNRESKPVFLYY